jgi:hypothetical protein
MPFSWSDTIITPKAIADAENLGLGGDVPSKVRDMLRHSTPFSHVRGNRRFGQVMMLVESGSLKSIEQIDGDPLKEALERRNKDKLAAKIKSRHS